MRNLTTAAVLAFGGLLFGAGDAVAQAASINVTPGAIVPPAPPATNSTFPASGTYVVPAGGTFTDVNCELGYYTAGRNGAPVWSKVSSKNALSANGAYSVTFNEVNDPNHIYVMRVKLITVGNPNGVATAEASY